MEMIKKYIKQQNKIKELLLAGTLEVKHFSNEAMENQDFILDILNDMSDDWQTHASFIQQIKKKFPQYFKDEDFVWEILKKDPFLFEYAAKNLKSDKEFVIKCIEEYPQCAEYFTGEVSSQLRDDDEYMGAALRFSPALLEIASKRIKFDKDFLLKVFRDNADINMAKMMEYIPKKLRNEEDFIAQVIAVQPCVYEYLPQQNQTKEFVMRLMTVYKVDIGTIFPMAYISDEDVKHTYAELFGAGEN